MTDRNSSLILYYPLMTDLQRVRNEHPMGKFALSASGSETESGKREHDFRMKFL